MCISMPLGIADNKIKSQHELKPEINPNVNIMQMF